MHRALGTGADPSKLEASTVMSSLTTTSGAILVASSAIIQPAPTTAVIQGYASVWPHPISSGRRKSAEHRILDRESRRAGAG